MRRPRAFSVRQLARDWVGFRSSRGVTSRPYALAHFANFSGPSADEDRSVCPKGQFRIRILPSVVRRTLWRLLVAAYCCQSAGRGFDPRLSAFSRCAETHLGLSKRRIRFARLLRKCWSIQLKLVCFLSFQNLNRGLCECGIPEEIFIIRVLQFYFKLKNIEIKIVWTTDVVQTSKNRQENFSRKYMVNKEFYTIANRSI